MRNVAVLMLALGLLLPGSLRAEDPAAAAAPVAEAVEPAPAAAPDGAAAPAAPAVQTAAPPAAEPAPPVPVAPEPVQTVPVPPVPVAPEPVAPAPVPVPPAAPAGDPLAAVWLQAAALLVGAILAGLVGLLTLLALRRQDDARRRRAVAATLAVELAARRDAFAQLVAPPNAEAGVSFVAAVLALAGFDAGWRAAQAGIGLLPPDLAGALARHYGGVAHVAGFVRGQSVAAALRMLQANRMGGHPCPDAGTMRDAHRDLAVLVGEIDPLLAELAALR
ncbi:hypothetical protein [Phaeospirillum tilakii]|uniref:Meckel syndrome type 1 protein n=1 Tax=Phaeospirillum tilakii TaxID=741673 RepID=A0ABW5C9G7_9PROT